MGLSIPEEYGGFGASAKVYNRVFRGDRLDRPGADGLLRRAPVHRLQGHRPLRHRGAEAEVSAAVRVGRAGCGILPHRARLRVRRAGDEVDGDALSRRHALPADGHEDLDLERRLRRSLHGLRQGRSRDRRKDEAARHGVHRRRPRAGHLARQARREDGHQGVGHARRLLRERAGARRGPAR